MYGEGAHRRHRRHPPSPSCSSSPSASPRRRLEKPSAHRHSLHSATRPSSQGPASASALRFNYFLIIAAVAIAVVFFFFIRPPPRPTPRAPALGNRAQRQRGGRDLTNKRRTAGGVARAPPRRAVLSQRRAAPLPEAPAATEGRRFLPDGVPSTSSPPRALGRLETTLMAARQHCNAHAQIGLLPKSCWPRFANSDAHREDLVDMRLIALDCGS